MFLVSWWATQCSVQGSLLQGPYVDPVRKVGSAMCKVILYYLSSLIIFYFSTAGRMFALQAADLGSIPPSLSESPASYREYPVHTAEPGKLPMADSICQTQ